jgi:hypothetical protein
MSAFIFACYPHHQRSVRNTHNTQPISNASSVHLNTRESTLRVKDAMCLCTPLAGVANLRKWLLFGGIITHRRKHYKP